MDVAAVPDPRRATPDKEDSKSHGSPSDRRYGADNAGLTWQEEEMVKIKHLPARPKSTGAESIQTNRAGWDIDKEGERREEWLQHRRSRSKVNRNKPTRTNI